MQVVTLVEGSNTIHNGFISLDPDLPNGYLHECGGGEQAEVRTWKGVDVVVCRLFLSPYLPLFYLSLRRVVKEVYLAKTIKYCPCIDCGL